MIKSKLITLLKTFSKKELAKFNEFVKSPFFNKNDKIVNLLNNICRDYPFIEEGGLQKENLYKKVFSGEKYNEEKLKNLVSDLYELAERFVVFISRDEKSIEFKRDIIRALRERNAEKLFHSSIKEAEKKLQTFRLKDRNYYYNKWLIDEEKNIFFSERDRIKYTKNLQSEFDNYLSYSLLCLMEFYIRLVNEEGYTNIKLLHTLENEILSFFHTFNFQDEPVLEIYYSALMLRITHEEKYFRRIKELKNTNYELLNKYDIYMINSNLQSFYLAQEMLGINIYRKDFFEIQKESLKDAVQFKEISFIQFLNLVKTAANIQEFEWLTGFIEEYKPLVAKKYRNDTVNFAYSYLHYKQGDSAGALEILSKVHTETVPISIEIRKLNMIIYYEEQATEAAFSMVDSFRHFINSGKIPTTALKNLLAEFVKYYCELLKLRDNKNITEAELLLKRIEKDFNVSNKNWLIKKTKELIGIYPVT